MKKWLKYFLNRITAPKYKRSGQCKQCGECCRSIVLSDNGKEVTSIEEFELLRDKYKKYNHFEPVKHNEQGILLFKCKSLDDNNRCRDYFFRSLYCRRYPDIDKNFILAGGVLLDNCGYKIEPSKKFSDYLD